MNYTDGDCGVYKTVQVGRGGNCRVVEQGFDVPSIASAINGFLGAECSRSNSGIYERGGGEWGFLILRMSATFHYH